MVLLDTCMCIELLKGNMNVFKKIYYRSYQFIMKYAAYFLNIHEPELVSEIDGVKKVPSILKEKGLPDINALANALGGANNITNISATISTITFQVTAMEKIDLDQLKKISIKGVIKSNDNVTLLIGDCAMILKEEILKLKSR